MPGSRILVAAAILLTACVAFAPGQSEAQALPETDVANPQCGNEIMARQLTYYRRTGAWIPESELRLPAREFLGETPADPTTLVEVSRYHPDCETGTEMEAAADAFVREAYRTALHHGWDRFEAARDAGFEPEKAHNHHETHFVHVENARDNRLLDPAAPEYLMYYRTDEGPLLVGMMFMVRTPDERGPQFGGARTVWHYHAYEDVACLQDLRISSPTDTADGPVCPEGSTETFASPEMLHVWFVDHPQGPYATSMALSPDVLARGIREDLQALR